MPLGNVLILRIFFPPLGSDSFSEELSKAHDFLHAADPAHRLEHPHRKCSLIPFFLIGLSRFCLEKMVFYWKKKSCADSNTVFKTTVLLKMEFWDWKAFPHSVGLYTEKFHACRIYQFCSSCTSSFVRGMLLPTSERSFSEVMLEGEAESPCVSRVPFNPSLALCLSAFVHDHNHGVNAF